MKRFRTRRACQGQALVLALGLLFAGALGLLFMFSAGQVTATKQRLVNAADSAAYSAAIWRARVMNYDAYSNRAIVLQEVAIAQAVTLTSWSRYFETFVRNVARVVSIVVPFLAPAMQALQEIVGYAQDAAESAATLEVWLRGADEIGYKNLLASSQEILHLSINTFGLGAVANEVARANDPDFFAFALPDEGAFDRLTRRYESDSDRQRLKALVLDSMDEFTKGPRGQDLPLPIPSGCVGSGSLDQWTQWVRKRGGTSMTPDLERWEAADTLSIHDWRRGGGLFSRGCRQQEIAPLGWGAAEASNGLNSQRIEGNPGDVLDNPEAADYAEDEMTSIDGYSGISRVRDLNYEALENPRFPTSPIAVLARIGRADVRTADVIGAGHGRLELLPAFASERLWALSAADVYFRRPPDAPARVEYASLYSPYWQARLTEPTESQRATAEAYLER